MSGTATYAGFAVAALLAIAAERAADDVPCQDLRALGDEHKRYFLIGPHPGRHPPTEGFALLIVMPGGDGGPDFNGFVKNVWDSCCPEDFVVAEMVSVAWTPDASTIWPTKAGQANGMKFTTQEFMDAVIEDVKTKQKLKIDPARTYQLAWSSGGPAAYAISLQDKRPVTGSYIAMSVFHPGELGSLKNAKGQGYFLDHSPDDATCKYECALDAKEKLTKAGAQVELVTYKGGHGWFDEPMVRLSKGIRWLDQHHGKPVTAGR